MTAVSRMTRAALEEEVRVLRAGRDRWDLAARGDRLEERTRDLRKTLAEERRLRVLAETNAKRFHAMMLQARIQLIVKKEGTAA